MHLHILKDKCDVPKLTRILNTLGENDSGLLRDNATFLLCHPQSTVLLAQHFKVAPLYVLQEDVISRGIELEVSNIEFVEIINYARFVELTLQYQKSISW